MPVRSLCPLGALPPVHLSSHLFFVPESHRGIGFLARTVSHLLALETKDVFFFSVLEGEIIAVI